MISMPDLWITGMPVQKTTGMPDLFCFSMRKELRAMRRIEYSYQDKLNGVKIKILQLALFSHCVSFWGEFFERKKIMLKIFVRSAKYIKISVFLCILIWDINFENLIISLKAAIVFLNTTSSYSEHRIFIKRWRCCSCNIICNFLYNQ